MAAILLAHVVNMADTFKQNTLTAQTEHQPHKASGQSSSSSTASSNTPAAGLLNHVLQQAQTTCQMVAPLLLATSTISAASNGQNSRWHS